MKKTYIWDWPTRIFHWLLATVILFSFYSGLNGGLQEMEYHKISGFCALTLIVFRIMWGFVSRGNARFSKFLVSPKNILTYIKSGISGTQKDGHNPLGGMSVIAMLFIVLIQTGTGLFANDDIWIEGPLVHLVSEKVSSQLTSIHHISAWLVGGLIILHLVAIFVHTVFLKHKIVNAMITGYRGSESQKDELKEIHPQQNLSAAMLLVIAATFVYTMVEYL